MSWAQPFRSLGFSRKPGPPLNKAVASEGPTPNAEPADLSDAVLLRQSGCVSLSSHHLHLSHASLMQRRMMTKKHVYVRVNIALAVKGQVQTFCPVYVRRHCTVAVLCVQKDQLTETAQVLACYAGCKVLSCDARLS